MSGEDAAWHDSGLFQRLQVGDERVDVSCRELVVLLGHRRLLGRVRLLRHRDRIDDPLPDVLGRELRADAVERAALASLAADGMAHRALLRGVHFLTFGCRILRSRPAWNTGDKRDGDTGDEQDGLSGPYLHCVSLRIT